MSVDTALITKLYEKYGSLDAAVSEKQRELEEVSKKAAGEEEMIRSLEEKSLALEKKICKQERRISELGKKEEELKREIHLVTDLVKMGFTPESLKALAKLAEGMGVGDLVKGFEKYRHLQELGSQVSSKEEECKTLDGKIEERKGKIAELEGEVKSLEEQKLTLQASLETLRKSFEALEGTDRRMKEEVERSRLEVNGLNKEAEKLRKGLEELKREDEERKVAIEEQRKALKTLEEQSKRVKEELEQQLSEKKKLEEERAKLSQTKSDLEKEIEQKKSRIESSEAIATLLTSSGIDSLKEFRRWLDGIMGVVTRSSPPPTDTVNAARRLIIEKLMRKTRVHIYKCRECKTRIIVETEREIGDMEFEYNITCPMCHFSTYISPDTELQKELFPTH